MTLSTQRSKGWRSKKVQETLSSVCNAPQALLGFAVAVPFFWLISTSLKPENLLFRSQWCGSSAAHVVQLR